MTEALESVRDAIGEELGVGRSGGTVVRCRVVDLEPVAKAALRSSIDAMRRWNHSSFVGDDIEIDNFLDDFSVESGL